MKENIKNAYSEVESLAYDLKYKSINQDEIKQGNYIFILLRLIDSLLKENEEHIEKLQKENEKKEKMIDLMAEDLQDLAKAINEEYAVEEYLLNKETIKQYYESDGE